MKMQKEDSVNSKKAIDTLFKEDIFKHDNALYLILSDIDELDNEKDYVSILELTSFELKEIRSNTKVTLVNINHDKSVLVYNVR